VSSAFVSRENRRLLTVSNDSPRARSLWKDSISACSRYSILTNFNDSPQPRSSWKDLIVASSSWKDPILARSSWKDPVPARSRYDNDSQYCIRLLYLSDDDLSENDYDLLWFSYLLRLVLNVSFQKNLGSSRCHPGWIFFLRGEAVTGPLIPDLVRTEEDWEELRGPSLFEGLRRTRAYSSRVFS
jgi:hypothetical protein